jgi:hypothetical protein
VSGSDEQPEEFECVFPFSGVHGLELGVDERERPGQGDADAAEEQREPGLGIVGQRGIQRGRRGQRFEDGAQFDLSSRRSKACTLSCSPLVTGRSQGRMTSRTFAFAVAWPMSSRSYSASLTKSR